MKRPPRWTEMPETQKAKIREAGRKRAAYLRKWRKEHPDHQHSYTLVKRHGLNREKYNEMCTGQKNRCAICGEPETKKMGQTVMRLSVDHDHKTDTIRQLLCSRCNAVLGLVYDNAKLLTRMVAYLKKHGGNG